MKLLALTHNLKLSSKIPVNLHELPATILKHLMIGPKGNSELCFSETIHVPRRNAEGNIEGTLINLPRFQGASTT